ncbi:MAG: hypothetical protein SFX46_05780, partial [Aeromonas hydrophila]|nr:hypothetical protein [Aeromonas hydrophila]
KGRLGALCHLYTLLENPWSLGVAMESQGQLTIKRNRPLYSFRGWWMRACWSQRGVARPSGWSE